MRAVRTHAKPGDLTEEDLRGYRALEREPVCGPYRAWRICSMGPPSSGGVAVLQILGCSSARASRARRRSRPQALHFFAEAGGSPTPTARATSAIPDFVHVPVKRLLIEIYLDKRAKLIGERADARSRRRATPRRRHQPLLDRRRATATSSR